MNYDQNNKSDNRKRKFFGAIFLLASLLCFLPKLLLFVTRDIPGLDFRTYTQKPSFLLVNLFLLPFGVLGLYFLLTKEPPPNIKNKRPLTTVEIKNNIRGWYIKMLCSIALIMASFALLSIFKHWLVYVFFVLAVASWLILMTSKRCPVCGYRIYLRTWRISPTKPLCPMRHKI